MRYLTAKNLVISIAVLSLVAVFVIILTQTNHILYDERYFIPNIQLISRLGLTKEFLLKITGSPGPTYAVVHQFFTGITHFSILGTRLINFGLLLVLLLFIYLNAGLLGAIDALAVTANFIFVPVVWVVCGLALTEVPTMLCAMISLYFLLRCLKNVSFLKRVLFAFIAGLFLSFSILGRSFFIMPVLAMLICAVIYPVLSKFDYAVKYAEKQLLFTFPGKTQTIVLLVVILSAALALPSLVFQIWGALAPPTETKIVGADSLSIVPWYGLLSFCYCGFVTLILAPGWFVFYKKLIIISVIASILFLMLNIYKNYFEFAPFMTAAGKWLSAKNFSLYAKILPAIVFLLSFHFLLSSVLRLWQHRSNPIFMFIGITALLIAFSAIKVKAQFSSRYVAQIVPYFILLFIPYEKLNWQKIIRVSLGAMLGFLSLYFYYQT